EIAHGKHYQHADHPHAAGSTGPAHAAPVLDIPAAASAPPFHRAFLPSRCAAHAKVTATPAMHNTDVGLTVPACPRSTGTAAARGGTCSTGWFRRSKAGAILACSC